MSIPVASLVGPVARDESVASTSKPSLARLLDDEDLRRARAALATALDPQGNGTLVVWANPRSGNKGSFTPSGSAYPSDAEICRDFRGEIDREGDTRSVRGTACADKAGEWTIGALEPLKKS